MHRKLRDYRVRKWIHGIAMAVLPMLTLYGWLSNEMAALWATLIGAVLVPGLALSDTMSVESDTRVAYKQGMRAADDSNGAKAGRANGQV